MHPISLNQTNQTSTQQQLLINLAMKQALHVLQMPLVELSEWLKNEIETNPVLEIDLATETFKESLDEPPSRDRSREQMEKRRERSQENMLRANVSLYEHLMQQAPLVFENRGDLNLAELIIGSLNRKGFLETPLEEIAPSVPREKMRSILETVQTLDPPGIAAQSSAECLSLQLRAKQKSHPLAMKIIEDHLEDLIHNRLPFIAKKLNLPLPSLVGIIEKEITPLELYPGYRYCSLPVAAIIPDLVFLCLEDQWKIEVNTCFLPKFQVAPIYKEALRDIRPGNEEYCYLRKHLAKARWLKRIVQRRNMTLYRIAEVILKKQIAFFTGDKTGLLSLSMKEIARELGLHESTVARAVNDKFLASPMGMFSLKSFFKQGLETDSGEKISNRSLRDILSKAIREEDKSSPLSDAQLVGHFHSLGIACKRRTITKYRSSLNIAPACRRRKWARK